MASKNKNKARKRNNKVNFFIGYGSKGPAAGSLAQNRKQEGHNNQHRNPSSHFTRSKQNFSNNRDNSDKPETSRPRPTDESKNRTLTQDADLYHPSVLDTDTPQEAQDSKSESSKNPGDNDSKQAPNPYDPTAQVPEASNGIPNDTKGGKAPSDCNLQDIICHDTGYKSLSQGPENISTPDNNNNDLTLSHNDGKVLPASKTSTALNQNEAFFTQTVDLEEGSDMVSLVQSGGNAMNFVPNISRQDSDTLDAPVSPRSAPEVPASGTSSGSSNAFSLPPGGPELSKDRFHQYPPPGINLEELVRRQHSHGTTGQDQGMMSAEIGEAILSHLLLTNSKLSKLDNIESMHLNLKGDFSKMQSQIQDMSSKLEEVKNDFSSQRQKWEADVGKLSHKVSSLDKGCIKIEKDWNKCKAFIEKELATAQSSIDSNSSKALHLEKEIEDIKDKGVSTEEIDKNRAKIEELEKELAYLKKQFGNFEVVEKKILKAADKKFDDLKGAIKTDMRREVVNKIRDGQATMAKDNDYAFLKMKAFAKRKNLILAGMPENESEEADKKASEKFFKDKLNLPKANICDAYRLGKSPNSDSDSSPRPLVVQFTNTRARWRAWNNKRLLAKATWAEGESPIWLQEDLPKRLREDNRMLQKIAKTARLMSDKYREVQVRDFELRIDGQNFNASEVWDLPDELTPEWVFTPSSDDAVAFFTKFSPFSNHYQCSFKMEGRVYNCVEQYLAYQKAALAEDQALMDSALEDKSSADYKVILNNLRYVPIEDWRKRAKQILPKVLRAKFTQNRNLAAFLKDTSPRKIGEASKDTFWGTGVPLENREVLNTEVWAEGGNLMGETLAKIRQELLNAKPK